MTSEEGVEEKQEEHDVRRAAEEVGKYFKLWMDKKYFIDEYDPPAPPPLSRLTFASRVGAIQQIMRQSRLLHQLLKVCRTTQERAAQPPANTIVPASPTILNTAPNLHPSLSYRR